MGTDCAPFIANLFLHYYELKYITDNKNSLIIRNNLKFAYRYIDDLTLINDNNFFEDNYKNIYPPFLELKKVNLIDNQNADVLDISVNITNNFFNTSLFDKRITFPFNCIQFPHYTSCLANKVFQNIIYTEINRQTHITNNNKHLQTNLSTLISSLLIRKFPKFIIQKSFKFSYHKNNVLKSRFYNLDQFLCLFPTLI